MIKTLDPKQPVTATPEIQALKNQLTEKERKIQHLEVSVFCLDDKKNSGHCGSLNLTNAWWSVPAAQHDYEKSRARHDQEEKLIISAWYNMVSECRHVLEGTSVLYWGFHVSLTTENHLVHRVLLRPNKDPYWTRQKFLFCILYILFYAHTWSITPSLSVCLSLSQGMALHQKVSGERVGPSNQAMSFLAQQRQSTNAKRGLTRHHPRWNLQPVEQTWKEAQRRWGDLQQTSSSELPAPFLPLCLLYWITAPQSIPHAATAPCWLLMVRECFFSLWSPSGEIWLCWTPLLIQSQPMKTDTMRVGVVRPKARLSHLLRWLLFPL